MKKAIKLIFGFIFLGLGSLGIALPILPTTPFILLAGACFASADERVYNWLCKTKYFGDYIENYRNKTGVPRHVKVHSLMFLWTGLFLSAVLVRNIYMTLGLAAIGVGVSIHILSLSDKKEGVEVKQSVKQK